MTAANVLAPSTFPTDHPNAESRPFGPSFCVLWSGSNKGSNKGNDPIKDMRGHTHIGTQ